MKDGTTTYNYGQNVVVISGAPTEALLVAVVERCDYRTTDRKYYATVLNDFSIWSRTEESDWIRLC